MAMKKALELALCLTATALALTLAAPPASAADCPNEAIRKSQTSEVLPNGTSTFPACMALEMVSPPKKFGQEAAELNAFSLDGDRARFRSKAALADTEGLLSTNGDSYLAIRTASGWIVEATSPPKEAQISVGGGPAGGPYAFSAELDGWLAYGATLSQQASNEGKIFKGGPGGLFAPFSPLLVPIDQSGIPQFTTSNFFTAGTAADLSATVFPYGPQTTALLPGDPPGGTYLASTGLGGEPQLILLSRDKDGKAWGGRCGSQLGGGGVNQGAISPDGSRIYLSTRPAQAEGVPCATSNPLRIVKRTEVPAGPVIEELFAGGPATGDDLYQGASVDGTKVFLATPRNLTASDLDTSPEPCGSTIGASKGCDLYLYDEALPPAERLIQVSAGGTGDPDPGKGANVLSSITALSTDGSHAYFAAQGVLTTEPNPEGAVAQAGQPNLYLYRRDAVHPAGETLLVGTLAPGDKFDGSAFSGLWGSGASFVGSAYAVPSGGPQGGDGHILLFASKASLTADDTDGGSRDVFRYDSQAETLVRISKALSGGSESPPADAVVNPNGGSPSSDFTTQGRWVSEDGQSVVFAIAEALDPADEDGAVSPYLWREGQLVGLPGKVDRFQQRAVVSPDGDSAGFTSSEPLLPIDGDTVNDAYVLRVGGGFPNPVPPTICNPLSEGACQGAPSTAPQIQGPATESFSGPGNPKAKAHCRKGQVRKRGRCVKAPRKARKQKRRASRSQGGNR
jgi:hypothetical protein